NVGPAVVVIIENRNPGAGGFNDVFLRVFASEYYRRREPGLRGDVGKMHDRCVGLSLGAGRILHCRCARMEKKPCAKSQQTQKPRKGQMQSHLSLSIVRWGWLRVN